MINFRLHSIAQFQWESDDDDDAFTVLANRKEFDDHNSARHL